MQTDTTETLNPYRTCREVETLVAEFENCTLPLARFKHPAHLTVALYYLTRATQQEATRKMRESLLRIIAHYGAAGYNETITLFWLRRVAGFLASVGQGRPFVSLLDELLESYGDARLIYDYYTRERLMSDEARAAWVEPDVKPLDF
ncbi:MAG TPA: hypothetical protein VGV59_00845 [Pyrinomonadaceae bacterium]|nr:hypothetical protein [Pyrinomonadaceae bacterium]